MWTIGDIIATNAHKYGSREALVHQDRRLSFADLDAEATRAAAAFQAMGIAKGDKVAIMGRNTPSWVAAFLGAVRAGAVVVPLNHKLAAPEVSYILDHSETKVWLVEAELAELAGKVGTAARTLTIDGEAAGLDRFEAAMSAGHAFRPVAVSADDAVEILYTSGTTGKPKGCLHSHANVQLATATTGLAYGLNPSDRTLIAMPVWHSFPLNNMLIGSFFVGATVVLLREYHPVEFLKAVQEERCTLFFGAPIAFLAALKMVPNFEAFDLSSVRAWLYGGGPIDAATARLLMDRYRSDKFYQVFGMTETGPTGTALYPWEQISKAGSIGRTGVPGCDVKVMKDNGAEAGPGEIGEIWIKCESVMLGYYRDPEATGRAFRDGWYLTGDLARLDEDGYLFIVDRVKDMIITGGENVYSKEVEDVLATCPGVNEVAVVGKRDPEWGEAVVAFVVPKGPLDEDAVRAYCAERLARYKIPREFRIVEQMPRTPTGKVMKYKLRELLPG